MADIVKLNNSGAEVKVALDKLLPIIKSDSVFTNGEILSVANGALKTDGWKVPNIAVPLPPAVQSVAGTSKELCRIDHRHMTEIDDQGLSARSDMAYSSRLTQEKLDEKIDGNPSTPDKVIDYTNNGCKIKVRDIPLENSCAVNKTYVDNAVSTTGIAASFMFGTINTPTPLTTEFVPIDYDVCVKSGNIAATSTQPATIVKAGVYRITVDAIYTPSDQGTIYCTVYGGLSGNVQLTGLSSSNTVPNPITARSMSMTRLVALSVGDKISAKIKGNIAMTLTHNTGGLTIEYVGP